MRNIKLTIAYDGAGFLGWQKTPDGRTVEEVLQQAIEKICQHNVRLQAASRTDAGVHASGQVVNFFTNSASLELSKLHFSLNRLLPSDIVILSVNEAPEHFHPTLSSIAKEYHYQMDVGPYQMPLRRYYAWHVPYKLDIVAIDQAIDAFLGEHDFEAFCNVRKTDHYTNFTRRIDSLQFCKTHDLHYTFKIVGNHFLFRMVRNIIGTLVDVGKKKIAPEDIPLIIASAKRPKAGISAPSHGLSLHRIYYPDHSKI